MWVVCMCGECVMAGRREGSSICVHCWYGDMKYAEPRLRTCLIEFVCVSCRKMEIILRGTLSHLCTALCERHDYICCFPLC